MIMIMIHYQSLSSLSYSNDVLDRNFKIAPNNSHLLEAIDEFGMGKFHSNSKMIPLPYLKNLKTIPQLPIPYNISQVA